MSSWPDARRVLDDATHPALVGFTLRAVEPRRSRRPRRVRVGELRGRGAHVRRAERASRRTTPRPCRAGRGGNRQDRGGMPSSSSRMPITSCTWPEVSPNSPTCVRCVSTAGKQHARRCAPGITVGEASNRCVHYLSRRHGESRLRRGAAPASQRLRPSSVRIQVTQEQHLAVVTSLVLEHVVEDPTDVRIVARTVAARALDDAPQRRRPCAGGCWSKRARGRGVCGTTRASGRAGAPAPARSGHRDAVAVHAQAEHVLEAFAFQGRPSRRASSTPRRWRCARAACRSCCTAPGLPREFGPP